MNFLNQLFYFLVAVAIVAIGYYTTKFLLSSLYKNDSFLEELIKENIKNQ